MYIKTKIKISHMRWSNYMPTNIMLIKNKSYWLNPIEDRYRFDYF